MWVYFAPMLHSFFNLNVSISFQDVENKENSVVHSFQCNLDTETEHPPHSLVYFQKQVEELEIEHQQK